MTQKDKDNQLEGGASTTSEDEAKQELWGAVDELSFSGSDDYITNEDDDEGSEHDDISSVDEGDDGYDDDAAEKKKKKLKTYALMGGIVVVMGGILLAGMRSGEVDQSSSEYREVAGSMEVGGEASQLRALDRNPSTIEIVEPSSSDRGLQGEDYEVTYGSEGRVYDYDEEQSLEPSPQQQALAEREAPQSDVIKVYSDGGYATQGANNDDEIIHHAVSEFMNEITVLSEKSELLAKSVFQLKEETEAISAQTAKITEVTTEHDARLIALEKFMKEVQEKGVPVAAKAKAPAPKNPAVAKIPTEPKKKPTRAQAELKPQGPKHTISITETEVASGKPVTPSAPAAKGALGSFKVVGVYPSERMGVSPEKAWVTDSETLIEVIVGSSLNGAKVTKIEGNAVYTNRGIIR